MTVLVAAKIEDDRVTAAVAAAVAAVVAAVAAAGVWFMSVGQERLCIFQPDGFIRYNRRGCTWLSTYGGSPGGYRVVRAVIVQCLTQRDLDCELGEMYRTQHRSLTR